MPNANAEIPPPPITMGRSDAKLWLRAQVSLDDLTGFSDATWQLAVTAVIEETNGRRSYWSLKHPRGKPDFHHSDGFALEIAAT